MDTNRLKRFACEARNILIGGVKQRLTALGFQSDGTVDEKPELMDGGSVFMGEIQTEDFYHKWMSLYNRLQTHSFREVVEEAAYTWFNRLVAIRIMVKNELVPAVLEYESDDVRIPIIVSEARQGRMPQMDDVSYQKLEKLLLNDALTDEQFALLIVAYCHSNPIIQKCFGNISDYTELLLPSNILKSEGFIDRLNADEYITTEDYRSPELIGWLYQFYISERKDEVFAKKGKFEADEIPAATQIFTPNWIVKYMVQNTVGRIYLDNNSYSEIKEGMKYLVEPTEPTPVDSIYQLDDIRDLKVADLACGSGHILNECFDLLYQIYIEEGYNRRQTVENIFRYNLTGVDIDTRAKQLATFALLMKACQKDKSFVDGHCMPRVLDMPQPYPHIENLCDTLPHFLLGGNQNMVQEITEAIELISHADTLGTIMKFNISENTRNAICVRMEEYRTLEFVPESIHMLLPYMDMILALTEQYTALVMNPPYMGSGNMNEILSKYVKNNYIDSKGDLATVFIEVMRNRATKNGKFAFIIPPSWMFLSTFESLRKSIIENQSIESLLHLSRGVFGADFGSSSAVITNSKRAEAKGIYFRLVERTFQEFDQKHLRMLFEKTLVNHDFHYYFSDYNKDVKDIVYSDRGAKIYYSNVPQQNFKNLPERVFGYWISSEIANTFNNTRIDELAKPSKGMMPGASFLRFYWEVSANNIASNILTHEQSKSSDVKWYLYFKGGPFRRWAGNLSYIVDYQHDGERVKEGDRNPSIYFKNNINWSKISSGLYSARIGQKGCLYDDAACQCYVYNEKYYNYILAFLNTKIAQEQLFCQSQTFNYISSEVSACSIIINKSIFDSVSNKSGQNINISKLDWDIHETSWDFELNPLLSIDENLYEENLNNEIEKHSPKTGEQMYVESVVLQLELLEWRLKQFKIKWERMFYQLHANEEELNRLFIDIYGLQDELTPKVPLDEVTILQQGEISIENDQIVWHDDIIIKQFISYAVGCLMGRYSIDCPGLILANQGDGVKEYKTLVPDSRIEIDDDGIIPLMSINNELTDHITLRFKAWLSKTLGEDNLMENVNYVERALGKRLEDYFLKDFWKDHKKMYQNRPIYWLFSSKKGAFQCITYMHRMNAYTAEKVRTQYLLPHIEWLVTRQAEMQANAANLSTRERKEMDAIGKQIEECREYHDRLHVVADKQIAFDLDDGVVVNYAKFGDVLVKLK